MQYLELFIIVELVEILIVSLLWFVFGLTLNPINTRRKHLAHLVTQHALNKEYEEMDKYLTRLNRYTMITFAFAFGFMLIGVLILDAGLGVLIASSTFTGLIAELIYIGYIILFVVETAIVGKIIKRFNSTKHIVGA